jgi:copper chaperone
MPTVTLRVVNISCHHCVMTIQRELSRVQGVEKVDGNVQAKTVTLVYQDAEALVKAKATLNEIGYPAAE